MTDFGGALCTVSVDSNVPNDLLHIASLWEIELCPPLPPIGDTRSKYECTCGEYSRF